MKWFNNHFKADFTHWICWKFIKVYFELNYSLQLNWHLGETDCLWIQFLINYWIQLFSLSVYNVIVNHFWVVIFLPLQHSHSIQSCLKNMGTICIHNVIWQIIPVVYHSVAEYMLSQIQSCLLFINFLFMTLGYRISLLTSNRFLQVSLS